MSAPGGPRRREDHSEAPEVHIAAVCVREPAPGHFEILVVRRDDDRALYPGLLEGCGGQLAPGERFTDAAARHLREEAGVAALPPHHRLDPHPKPRADGLHTFYEIPLDTGGVIPGIRFLMIAEADAEPTTARARWSPVEEFRGLPASSFVPGFKADALGIFWTWRRVHWRYR